MQSATSYPRDLLLFRESEFTSLANLVIMINSLGENQMSGVSIDNKAYVEPEVRALGPMA